MPREPPGAQLSLLQLLDALKCRITKEILKEVHKPVMHETDVQFTYRTRQRISSIKRQVMTSLDAVLAPHMNQSLFNRLPDELLSEIFLWNVEACSEPSEWMPIMRVCKRWRRIAQNTPRLWGTVNIRWPRKILHQFLHHHRNAPLHVSIRDDVKWSMDAMTRFSFRARSFIANLDHMESLQIHLPNREYLELYRLLLYRTAPKLKCLEAHAGQIALREGDFSSYLMSKVITKTSMPLLERLSLTGICAPRQANIYSGLKILTLAHQRFSSVDNLADILRATTVLEVLLISDCDFVRDDQNQTQQDIDPLAKTATISLSRLKELTLQRIAPVCLAGTILSAFTIPSSASVTLELCAKASDRLPIFLPAIRTAVHTLITRSPKLIVHIDPTSLEIQFCHPTHPPRFTLRFDWEPPFSLLMGAFDGPWAQLAQNKEVTDVQLTIAEGFEPSLLEWRTMLRSWPALSSIAVHGGCSDHLIMAFDDGQKIICPKLISLDLSGSSLHCERLRLFLRRRRAARLHIDILDLTDSRSLDSTDIWEFIHEVDEFRPHDNLPFFLDPPSSPPYSSEIDHPPQSPSSRLLPSLLDIYSLIRLPAQFRVL